MSTDNRPTRNKTQLASAYGISIATLQVWLADIPGLELRKGQRIFTPKQLRLIYAHLDEPNSEAPHRP
jgi:hypothetical protein